MKDQLKPTPDEIAAQIAAIDALGQVVAELSAENLKKSETLKKQSQALVKETEELSAKYKI